MEQKDCERKQLFLEEYKKTIDVAIYEGTTYWSRFNVFFAVNAAILIFLGVILGDNSVISLQTEDSRRILVLSVCFLGFVSSVSMFFACFRSQAVYRYWWDHLKKLEQNVLTELTLVKDMDTHFDRQNFLRLQPVITSSLFVPFFLSALFYSLPIFLYGLQNVALFLFAAITIPFSMILYSAYLSFKRSWRTSHSK